MPKIKVIGLNNPVVQIIDENSNEIIYTLRIKGSEYRPKVFNKNHTYTIKVGKSITHENLNEVEIHKNIKPDLESSILEILYDNEEINK